MPEDSLKELRLDQLERILKVLRGLSLEEFYGIYLVPEVPDELGEPETISIQTKYGDLTFSYHSEKLGIALFNRFAAKPKQFKRADIETFAKKNKLEYELAAAVVFDTHRQKIQKRALHAFKLFVLTVSEALQIALEAHATYIQVRTNLEIEDSRLRVAMSPAQQVKEAAKLATKMARHAMNAPGRGRGSDWSKWGKDKVERVLQETIASLPERLLPTQEKVTQKINRKYRLEPPLTAAALGKTLHKFQLSWKELRNRKK